MERVLRNDLAAAHGVDSLIQCFEEITLCDSLELVPLMSLSFVNR